VMRDHTPEVGAATQRGCGARCAGSVAAWQSVSSASKAVSGVVMAAHGAAHAAGGAESALKRSSIE